MSRPILNLRHDLPLRCKQDVYSRSGKVIPQGEIFDWKANQIDEDRIKIMFLQGYFYHDPDDKPIGSSEKVIGDGLEQMDIESLTALVENINVKVRLAAKNEKDFLEKKCPISKIKDKQIGLIRRWRLTYGDIE